MAEVKITPKEMSKKLRSDGPFVFWDGDPDHALPMIYQDRFDSKDELEITLRKICARYEEGLTLHANDGDYQVTKNGFMFIEKD